MAGRTGARAEKPNLSTTSRAASIYTESGRETAGVRSGSRPGYRVLAADPPQRSVRELELLPFSATLSWIAVFDESSPELAASFSPSVLMALIVDELR